MVMLVPLIVSLSMVVKEWRVAHLLLPHQSPHLRGSTDNDKHT